MNPFVTWWRTHIARDATSPPAHVYGVQALGKGQGVTQFASVTVTTTATLVLAFNGNRRTCALTNTGATTVSLGNSTIVAGQGIQLAAGDTWVDSDSVAAWYGIVASGTSTVAPLEVA